MQIDYLANHPEFIPTLARWHHQEWAYLRPGESLEARITRLRDACGRKAIPTVVIAFTDSTLLGSGLPPPDGAPVSGARRKGRTKGVPEKIDRASFATIFSKC